MWPDPMRPLLPCSAPAPSAPSRLRTWRVANHDGKDYLVLRCGGTGCMACESTVLTSVDGKPVSLAIKDKQVFISGPHFEGTADRLNMSDREGEFILKGHVRIEERKHGGCREISADRAVLGLDDGVLQLKAIIGVGQISVR